MEEWGSDNYPRIELTSEHLEWDLTGATFQAQEEAMAKWCGTTCDNMSAGGGILWSAQLIIPSMNALLNILMI